LIFPPPLKAVEQRRPIGTPIKFTATILQLASSLVISRSLSTGALLIFSYFVGPEPFAPFGVFIAIVTILWVGIFGCYEQALFVCRDEEIAPLARLCCAVATLVLVAVSLICVGITMVRPGFVDTMQGLPLVVIAIPFALAARALHRLVCNLATRAGHFSLLVRSNWMQAAVQGSVLLALLAGGLPAIACLVAADVVGLAAVTALMLLRLPTVRSMLLARLPRSKLMSCARSWVAMPSWRLAMSLTSVTALSLPALTIPLFFPAAFAGQIVFAMRMLELPSNVVTGAVTPILQNHLSSEKRSRSFAVRAVIALTALTVVTFGIIAMLIAFLTPVFQGSRWAIGVESVAPLTIYFIGLTISAPFVGSVIGVAIERGAAASQLIFLSLTASAVVLMAAGLPLFWVLEAFGMACLLRALVSGAMYIQQHPREGAESNVGYR
jgi:hypothetical protein